MKQDPRVRQDPINEWYQDREYGFQTAKCGSEEESAKLSKKSNMMSDKKGEL